MILPHHIDLSLLQQVPIFHYLAVDERAALAAHLHQERVPAGTQFFEQGDAGDRLYIIVEGYVRLYLVNIDGHEITLRVHGPGNSFGEFALLDNEPRTASAMALTAVSALTLYHGSFNELLDTYPRMARSIIRMLTQRLRLTTLLAEDLAFLSATGRIAAYLVRLAQQQAPQGVVRLEITQEVLATHIGVSREWVNKALNDIFVPENLIQLSRGAIVVMDQERLRRWEDTAQQHKTRKKPASRS